MADFIYEPILDTDANDTTDVLRTARRILDPGAYENAADFPNMPHTKADFEKEVTKLSTLDASSKGNSDILLLSIVQRNLLYSMIKEIYVYIYPLCLNKPDMIIKSGFRSNSPATKHNVIGPVNIKNIVAGNDAGTVKISIDQLEGDQKTLKSPKTYLVYVFEDLTSAAVRTGCITSDSRKLIVENVPLLKLQYYAIVVQNSAGTGPISARRNFTLAQ